MQKFFFFSIIHEMHLDASGETSELLSLNQLLWRFGFKIVDSRDIFILMNFASDLKFH